MSHLLFSELPLNAKKALIIYFAIDCDNEHFTQPAERQPTESEWQHLLQEAEQHCEALLDGWHRFHRYVQLEAEHIPFIRFVNDAL